LAFATLSDSLYCSETRRESASENNRASNKTRIALVQFGEFATAGLSLGNHPTRESIWTTIDLLEQVGMFSRLRPATYAFGEKLREL